MAGGLGASALPYLAGAGIGRITIIDHDVVDITNLHRQTIYKESDAGKSKATLAADYLKSLNSEIKVTAIGEKLSAGNAEKFCNGFDIILDGSDNFETKSLLNTMSIKTKTPLITASVEEFNGMAAIFAGYYENAPCYHCLYPELPLDACNCNEAGILGTVAGLAGLYQAHLALCYLLNIGATGIGSVLKFDFRNFRAQHLNLKKNPDCAHCAEGKEKAIQMTPKKNIPLIRPADLKNHIIVDVRTHEEIANQPIDGAVHYPLDTFVARYRELPKDKLLALACASNIRSRHAAEFLAANGYENVCVMDVLAG